jgi:Holliday junction resolvase-like predicted endonuclease
LVKALLSLKARIAKLLSVGFHIIESHNVIKIHNTIRAFAIDKNNISARIFLFSVLFILEKNMHKHIHEASKSHTKWKLKF